MVCILVYLLSSRLRSTDFFHLFSSCTDLLEIRTEMFYKIVDMLIVEDSVCLFDQDDDEVAESLLGGMNHDIYSSSTIYINHI
jgi:hypothetical protein